MRNQTGRVIKVSFLISLTASTFWGCKSRATDNSSSAVNAAEAAKDAEDVKNFVGDVFATCVSDKTPVDFSLVLRKAPASDAALLTYAHAADVNANDGKLSLIGQFENHEEKNPIHHLFVFKNLSLIVTIDQLVQDHFPGTIVGKEANGSKIDHNLLCLKP